MSAPTETNGKHNSDPRARFREVQTDLHALLERPGDFELNRAQQEVVAELVRTEKALLATNEGPWLKSYQDHLPGLTKIKYRCGEPHVARFDARQFPRAAPHLLEHLPSLRVLVLDLPAGAAFSDDLAAHVFGAPVLARLDGLSLKGNWGDRAAHAAAASPFLGALRSLDLSGCNLGPAGADAVLRSPRLGQLTHLDLSDNRLGGDFALLVFGLPALVPPVRALHLEATGIHDGAAALLAAAGALGSLRELWLGDNPALTEAGITDLLSAPVLKRATLDFGLDPCDASSEKLEHLIERHNTSAAESGRSTQ